MIGFAIAAPFLISSWSVCAQTDSSYGSGISIEQVKSYIENLKATDAGTSEENQTALLDVYTKALDRLQSAEKEKKEAKQFKKILETGPTQVKDIEDQINKLKVGDGDTLVSSLAISDLEPRVTTEQSDLIELRQQLSALRNQLTDLNNRPGIARRQATDARKMLEEVRRTGSSDNSATGGDPNLIETAKAILLKAREEYRVSEINRLDQELLSHEMRTQLVQSKAQLLELRIEGTNDLIAKLNERLQKVQQNEADRAEREAVRIEQEASDSHPLIHDSAERNAELSKELAALLTQQNKFTDELNTVREKAEQVSADSTLAMTRLQSAQVSEALGQVLREQRSRLPQKKTYRREARIREREIAKITAGQFQTEQRLDDLEDIEQIVAGEIEKEIKSGTPGVDRKKIEKDLKELLANQKSLLEKLHDEYGDSLRVLANLEFEQKQLVDDSSTYAKFLDERLLWIRSSPALGVETLKDLPDAVSWQVSSANWGKVASTLAADFYATPLVYLLAAVLFGIVIRYRPFFRRTIVDLADKIKRIYSDSFLHTINALIVTLLLAVPLPILSGFLAWRLLYDHPTDPFIQSVGGGLAVVAISLFLLRFLYHFTRKNGVAQAHFQWRESTLKLLRTNLPWLTIVFFVTIMLAFIDWNRPNSDLQSLTRFAFIGVTVALAIYGKRVFEPENGVFSSVIARHPNGWLSRLRSIWYPSIIGIPLVLAVLAGLGYLATAGRLYSRLESTVWLILAVVIIQNLVERFLIVAQRKLAIKKARERSEAEKEESKGVESSAEGDRVLLDTAELDISTINAQTRHLMKTILGWSVVIGVWWIWSNVLPALGGVDKFTLWQINTVVDGETVSTPITLTTILGAFVIGLIAAAAARNLPGVLEIAVLQRLPIDFGSRYAITKISQYVIIAAGIFIIFSTIGVAWSDLQWLVAALGVGLGFGLQEIFANFMSGLIMLFERPVRIGDTVTIGDLSGTVSRMRMRATTITDWDNKEIIVPNKMFITDRLINWTLSDPITRVIMPIGIAYGSDTNLAYRLICETAEQNPLVLKEPQLQVFFLGFGDSSLDFELRVFVRDLADRLRVQHELHMAINRVFADNDIEIPFPQRDLHVRSWIDAQELGSQTPKPSAS